MTRRVWAYVRLAGAAAVLLAIVERLGTGPFLTGLRSVGGGSVAAASGIALLTTASCAWRWCLVARGLGVPLRFRTALAAYYRSQFLNGTLPGGILGDVHRGMRHGRDTGDLGRGLRAVAWERTAGQAVQVVVAVLVLSAARSPVRPPMPVALVAAAACVFAIAVAVRVVPRSGSSLCARVGRTLVADLHDGVVGRKRWPGVVGTSLLAVAGHVATFVIAARAAGSTASFAELLPLTLLVLLAAAVPVNVGGWGPREGVAAWVFGAAGLGAAQGVAAGTAYGVLAAAASLPGAVVLVAGWLGRRSWRKTRSRRVTASGRRPELAAQGVLSG
jgi:glycosyltransferase 2 family protein